MGGRLREVTGAWRGSLVSIKVPHLPQVLLPNADVHCHGKVTQQRQTTIARHTRTTRPHLPWPDNLAMTPIANFDCFLHALYCTPSCSRPPVLLVVFLVYCTLSVAHPSTLLFVLVCPPALIPYFALEPNLSCLLRPF